MLFNVNILLLRTKAILRKALSFAIKRDRLAFLMRHSNDSQHITQALISKIPKEYVLNTNRNQVFLSTAFPFFLWEGRNENRAYFLPRIPVSTKAYKYEFNLNNSCGSGSRLIFTTDSLKIQIRVQLNKIINTRNMPITSLAGLDIFEIRDDGEHWIGCYTPNNILCDSIDCIIYNKNCQKRTYKIYLPLFSQVQLIQIGFEKKAMVYLPKIKHSGLPIAVYGSSITQGCASSRPSLSYANRISRQINREVFNFGFSGSARGEEELAQYISGLSLSAIILEYDHNVSVETLQKTHYKFYSAIRVSQKQIPIIMFSRCSGGISIPVDEERQRYHIIEQTYELARANGDTSLYLLRGDYFFENKEECFVDDRHPNDIGMKIIAEKLLEVLKQAEKIHE